MVNDIGAPTRRGPPARSLLRGVRALAGAHGQRLRLVGGLATSGLTALALGWLVWRNAGAWPSLRRSLDLAYLPLAFVAYSLALLVAAYTWQRLVGGVAPDDRRLPNARLYLITAFARRLPGSLWGTALRMYWYRRLGGDWRVVGVASVLEVWAVSVAGVILGALGLGLFVGAAFEPRLWIGCLVVLAALGVTCLPMVNRRLLRRLFAWVPSTGSLPLPPPSERARWVLLELLTWLGGGLELAAILRAITPYPVAALPSIVTSWVVAGTAGTLITFIPAGFGLVEFLLIGLLGLKFSVAQALVAALGLRVFTTLSEALWMLVAVGATAIRRRRLTLAPALDSPRVG